MTIAIIWQRFLPYHRARIRRTAIFLQRHGIKLIAIEVATQDTTYGFPPENPEDTPPIQYHCCFPDANYHKLSANQIHDAVFDTLCRLQPNIVFAPATPFPEGMAAIRYGTDRNKKSVMMDDSWELTDQRGLLVRSIKRLIHRNVDAAFIPAESHKTYFAKMGFSDDRLLFGVDVVDNNYYSHNADEASKKAADFRGALRLPDDYFLFVGRVMPKKGLDTLLRAYDIYRSSVNGRKWDLVIVGMGGNFEEMQRTYASRPDIHFPGAQFGNDLCYHYALARALIVPSLSDQWGLVINEGMACGLPVIASTGCGATATLVHDGDNGWTFKPGDVNELARCMIEAHGAGKERLASMGARSKEIIAGWSTTLFAESVFKALNIPRREPAGIISNILTRLWKGHVRTY
jgi:glycosyltransferase involved in cell wall biosynthesis